MAGYEVEEATKCYEKAGSNEKAGAIEGIAAGAQKQRRIRSLVFQTLLGG
jgi:hypothetical protein